MKHLRTYFILTIIAFVITSCTDGKQMRQRLADVQACNQADTVFSSRWLPTADSLVDYFDSHGTPNERLMAHYLQGRVYHDMGEAPRAIEEYHRAVECADTTSTDCDYDLLAKVHGQAASLFMEQLMPNEMLEELHKEAYYAKMANDTLHQLIAIAWQHSAYDMLNHPDSAVSVLQYVLDKYQEYGYREDVASTASTLCIYMVERKDFCAARKLIELQHDAMGPQMIVEDSIISYYLGIYHLEVGSLDSAEQYFRGLLHSQNLNNREAACKGLTSLYQAKADCDSVAKYALLSYQIANERFLISNKEELQNIQALYNYNRNQRLAQERALEASRNKAGMLLFAFLSILLFLSILTYWHRKKRQINQMETEYYHLMELQEQARFDLVKMKDEEKEELLRQKEKEIQGYQQAIDEIQKVLKKEQTIEPTLADSDVYKHFVSLTRHTNEKVCKKDWAELSKLVDGCLPHFRSTLYSKCHLNELDYHLCLLIRLHFSLSEIGILLEESPQYISKRRKSLLKCIFHQEGKPEIFDRLLMRMS